MGDFVVRALNEALRDGELSATQKQGKIICILKGHKKIGGQFLFKMLCHIGSSCIANRIKTVFPLFINKD